MNIMFVTLQGYTFSQHNPSDKSEGKKYQQSYNNNFILPVFYHLRSFYKKVGKHYDKYKWFPCEYGWKNQDPQKIVNTILKNKIDVLCLSMFIWNWEIQIEISRLIKEKNPNIKIIVGGSQLDYKDPDIATKHPYFDYIVYGEGEVPFQMLLDSFYEKIDEKTIPNLITKNFKTKNEVFKFSNYPPYSPILDLKEAFIEDYAYWNANKANPNTNVVLFYEKVKGCPYNCAFCAWGGGIHNKVTIRSTDWREELKFLSNYDVTLCSTDANFGMFKEDIEMLELALSLRSKKSKFNFILYTYSKLKKEKVFAIWELEYRYGKRKFRVALQNLDADVLSNIERPEIPWDKHKKMLIDWQSFKNDVEYDVEVIHGLPGMTVDNTKKMLLEFADTNFVNILFYPWRLLPNTLSNDKDYQKKYNLKIFNRIELMKPINSNLDDLYDEVVANKHGMELISKEETIYDGKMSFEEYITIIYLIVMYNTVFEKNKTYDLDKFELLMKYTLSRIENLVKEQSNYWREKLKKYGFIVTGLNHNGKVYTFNYKIELICEEIYKEFIEMGG